MTSPRRRALAMPPRGGLRDPARPGDRRPPRQGGTAAPARGGRVGCGRGGRRRRTTTTKDRCGGRWRRLMGRRRRPRLRGHAGGHGRLPRPFGRSPERFGAAEAGHQQQEDSNLSKLLARRCSQERAASRRAAFPPRSASARPARLRRYRESEARCRENHIALLQALGRRAAARPARRRRAAGDAAADDDAARALATKASSSKSSRTAHRRAPAAATSSPPAPRVAAADGAVEPPPPRPPPPPSTRGDAEGARAAFRSAQLAPDSAARRATEEDAVGDDPCARRSVHGPVGSTHARLSRHTLRRGPGGPWSRRGAAGAPATEAARGLGRPNLRKKASSPLLETLAARNALAAATARQACEHLVRGDREGRAQVTRRHNSRVANAHSQYLVRQRRRRRRCPGRREARAHGLVNVPEPLGRQVLA